MNPALLRAQAVLLLHHHPYRPVAFRRLALFLLQLADEVEAGVWPDSRTSTEGKTGEAA